MGYAAERAAGLLRGRRFLVCDGDTKFRYRFKIATEAAGIGLIKRPYRAPNANAYAERFVRSIKHECLDRMILSGEAHLRRAVEEYLAHSTHERNHRGLGNELIHGRAHAVQGSVECNERLGGLLEYYRRAARLRRRIRWGSSAGEVCLSAWIGANVGRRIDVESVTSSASGQACG